MAFDYIFKRTMEELLGSCGARAEKVGTLPLEIDTVARCRDGKPDEIAAVDRAHLDVEAGEAESPAKPREASALARARRRSGRGLGILGCTAAPFFGGVRQPFGREKPWNDVRTRGARRYRLQATGSREEGA